MIIRGKDKNGKVRTIRIEQEFYHIGKSIRDMLEGKTDPNIHDFKKDFMRGLQNYYIDDLPVEEREVTKLLEEIKIYE